MNILAKSAIAITIASTALFVQAKSVKQIVLESISTTTTTTSSTSVIIPRQDAAEIRLLVENEDNKLEQRSASRRFYSGERFKVLIKPSRDGVIALYNTPPSGVMNTTPLWQTQVRAGQEVISPNLVLTGQKGNEILHISLLPVNEPPVVWIQSVFQDFQVKKGKAKDIQLEDSGNSSYVLAPPGAGIYQQIIIRHK